MEDGSHRAENARSVGAHRRSTTTVDRPLLSAVAWTSAGDVGPLDDVQLSPFGIRERTAAIAAAGYVGVGLVYEDVVAAHEAVGASALRSLLSDHGIVHLEFEMLNDWYAGGERRAASDRVRRELFELANTLGASYIKVAGQRVTGNEGALPWPQFADAFGQLCEDAASAGVRLSIELMAHTNVADVASAVGLVDHAGYSGAGFTLDSWHCAHAAMSPEQIAGLEPRYIFGVELSDGSRSVDVSIQHDSVYTRVLCGQGDLDIPGFIRAVRATGWDGVWGVEVMSSDFRRLHLLDQTTLSHDAAHAVLVAQWEQSGSLGCNGR